MSTWREFLEIAMREAQDRGPVVTVAPNDSVLDVSFDSGYGSAEGPKVLVWTKSRVYFPVEYAGSERMASAPRNPQKYGQGHVSG
jgi:hypothetical protein